MLLVGSDNQKQELPIKDAWNRASGAGVDLVVVAENSNPAVCRLMDYGKHLYDKKKKFKEQKKSQKKSSQKLKEIKFNVGTEAHDYNVKLNHIISFLGKGHKVKVSLFFRGREIQNVKGGFEMINRVTEDLKEHGTIDEPTKSGRSITTMVIPK